MYQRELERYLRRNDKRKEQKRIFQQTREYKRVQNIFQKSKSSKCLSDKEAADSLGNLYFATNDLEENQQALRAEYGLHLGACLNAQKDHINNIKPGSWTKWRNEHIPFIGVRKSQDLMRVAKDDGVYGFTYLGTSALVLILSKIDDLYPENKYKQRYYAFFQESSYPCEEYKKTAEVKKLIEAHVFEVRAKREGIKCDIDNIKALVEYPDTLNDQLIEILHQTIADGGSPDKRLERIIMGKGKLPKLTPPKKPTVLPISFDRNVAMTKQISKYYHENNHKIDEIRIKAIEDSVEVLTSLYWEKFTHDLTKHL